MEAPPNGIPTALPFDDGAVAIVTGASRGMGARSPSIWAHVVCTS